MAENEKHIDTIETILFTAATNGASLVQDIHVPALSAALDALRRTAEDDCSKCIITSGAHEASGKHIRDLLAAEKEGLLVRLPCKVGDTVYEPYGDHANKWKVKAFEIGEDLEPRPGYYVPYEGFFAHTFKEGEIFTVYLTPEAARAALGGGEGEG